MLPVGSVGVTSIFHQMVNTLFSSALIHLVQHSYFASKIVEKDNLSSDIASSRIVNPAASLLHGVSLIPVVGNRGMATAAWSLIPARCSAPNSNSENLSRERASFPVAYVMLRILRNAS